MFKKHPEIDANVVKSIIDSTTFTIGDVVTIFRWTMRGTRIGIVIGRKNFLHIVLWSDYNGTAFITEEPSGRLKKV